VLDIRTNRRFDIGVGDISAPAKARFLVGRAYLNKHTEKLASSAQIAFTGAREATSRSHRNDRHCKINLTANYLLNDTCGKSHKRDGALIRLV